ncbi:glycosyltransferase [Armatimonas sp.]|uniref:glycosyltransferase n=1 Tax=Armatimonas sp. TaxID=1872638 RepID=UPI00375151F2
MRVLFVSCDSGGAVTLYRCTHLASALQSVGNTAEVTTIYQPVIELNHDVVVLHRICANEEGQALADAVRKSGATLIYGADDLVWEASSISSRNVVISPGSCLAVPSSPVAPSSREEGLACLHLAMLQQADGVLVSTNALAEFAGEAGASGVAVIRNTRLWRQSLSLHSFPEKLWAKHCPVQEGTHFTILYPAGTATHDTDLAEVAPALKIILEHFPQVRLVLIGPVTVPEILLPFASVIARVPLLKMDQYLAAVSCADVVIAPLAPNRFNQGKSELKWLEAGSWAKPTLASKWGGFSEAIREGENGLLADTTEEWVAKLTRLIEDEVLRNSLGTAARQYQRFDWSTTQTLTEVPFLNWRQNKTIQPTRFVNPRGFVKGKVKSVLRRLKA